MDQRRVGARVPRVRVRRTRGAQPRDDAESRDATARRDSLPSCPTVALAVWMGAWVDRERDALVVVNMATGGSLLAIASTCASGRRNCSKRCSPSRRERRSARRGSSKRGSPACKSSKRSARSLVASLTTSTTCSWRRRRSSRSRDAGSSEARLCTRLDEIESVLWRAADLTGRLLDLARKREPKPVAVDPADALERLRVLLEKVVPSMSGSRSSKIASRQRSSSIRRGLDHALLNLGLNARERSGEDGGAITLRGRLGPVDGIGARPSCSKSATTAPASQATCCLTYSSRSSRRSQARDGLGLAMVEAFASSNGGVVSVTSPGRDGISARVSGRGVASVAPPLRAPRPPLCSLSRTRTQPALATAGALERAVLQRSSRATRRQH